MTKWADIVFTDAVRAAQEKYGTRDFNTRLELSDRTPDLDEFIMGFIRSRDSIYFGTASASGRPYIQHRGGEAGFIKVLDSRTLGIAEYPGNKQLITTGNLTENSQAFIFLMDYPSRQRVKLWGRADIVDDPEFIKSVGDEIPGRHQPERALRFRIDAWDINCPKYITPRYTEADVARATEKMRDRIAELEAENSRLKEQN